ncbi:SAF domain-containing protein [Paenibacillus apiarius]|uniref:SAF domain-containing protein n=1 Tax=Paenibacillus apiarius TaxID=46240 RepID=A0ABT4DX45_9BACL|nr:SAF domain-containing protein [Paenibacillus apiarius]MCY9515923.1 SAF domain-containing protein [Paenibacillus apiarius]MCY9520833.1 SAF domain-containing protein [Paenibacillus apiarius]MCY9553538.1 SAF domain-containing protein [Paenibacillus apiarius]MCY9557939.1 SAF domain-containing protein [Paenibacillus apiarius]MCY9685794.1 SAF domain-containing protein [Paenibacillus apiarius]
MKRWTRRTKQMLICAISGAVAAGLLAAAYHHWALKNNNIRNETTRSGYEQEINRLKKLADEQQKERESVWVFKKPLLAGKRIGSQDIARIEVSADAVPRDRLNHPDNIVGKVLKIDVSAQMPILFSMLYEEAVLADDMRWIETGVIQLPLSLTERDAVDVRIRFPNGSDYVVLAQKAIRRIQLPTIWMQLDEQERLMFSSACVDAYRNGGQIYALRYVEPHLQKKAVPNYPANADVLELVASNPNIVKKADTALARAVRQQMEKGWEKQKNADSSERDGGRSGRTSHAPGSAIAAEGTEGGNPASVSGYAPFTGNAAEAKRNSPFVGVAPAFNEHEGGTESNSPDSRQGRNEPRQEGDRVSASHKNGAGAMPHEAADEADEEMSSDPNPSLLNNNNP